MGMVAGSALKKALQKVETKNQKILIPRYQGFFIEKNKALCYIYLNKKL